MTNILFLNLGCNGTWLSAQIGLHRKYQNSGRWYRLINYQKLRWCKFHYKNIYFFDTRNYWLWLLSIYPLLLCSYYLPFTFLLFSMGNLVVCPYSAKHFILKSWLQWHMAKCPNRPKPEFIKREPFNKPPKIGIKSKL